MIRNAHTYIYMCIYIYTCTCVIQTQWTSMHLAHTDTFIYLFTFIHSLIHFMHSFIHTFIHSFIQDANVNDSLNPLHHNQVHSDYIQTHIRNATYIYIYIHIHTYTYIYTYIYHIHVIIYIAYSTWRTDSWFSSLPPARSGPCTQPNACPWPARPS